MSRSGRVWSVRAIGVAAVVVAASGCAARQSRLNAHFVKPGEPAVAMEAPAVHAAPMQDFMRRVRTLQAKAAPKSSLLPTIEGRDPALAKALLILAMQESPEHHRLVADAYRNAGVLDYAYRHYQRAALLGACDGAAFDGMARLWRDWGMPDLALGDAYRAVHCNPGSAESYNTLGTILQALGQTANARRAYGRSVELDSKASFALNNLCYLDMKAGKGQSAERLCEAALAIEPTFAAARNNLALSKAIRGDVAGAERVLQAAGSADSEYNLGLVRLALGRYRDAAKAFTTAAAEQPSLAIAWRRAVQARQAAIAADEQ